MEPEGFEVLARPANHLSRLEVATFAFDQETAQTIDHVRVEVVELLVGVPGAEVLAPTPDDRIEIGDHLADVRVASPPRGLLPHALPNALHRALRRPAMKEVELLLLSFPYPSAHSLVQMAAEEVEAFFAIEELHLLRLLGM